MPWRVASLLIGSLLAAAASGDPFQPGNLIISSNVALHEYTRDGELLQSIPIPCGSDVCPYIRHVGDVVVDVQGRAHVYNGIGSSSPATLSSYDPATDTWTHRSFPGLNRIANSRYGGIVASDGYVYLTDNDNLGPGGIVRFDLESDEAVRFGEEFEQCGGFCVLGPELFDLALGPDGVLYGLDRHGGCTVASYDLATLRHTGCPYFTPETLRSIALDSAGALYLLADGRQSFLIHDPPGTFAAEVPFELLGPHDIDVASDGLITIVSRFYELVVLTDATGEVRRVIEPPVGYEVSVAHVPFPEPILVAIDIRPGDPHNRLDPRRRGLVRVAILGSPELDVVEIEPTTLTFGPEHADRWPHKPALARDTDHDGFPDLIVSFSIADSGIAPGDVEACIDGELRDGAAIRGCDFVRTRVRPWIQRPRHWRRTHAADEGSFRSRPAGQFPQR